MDQNLPASSQWPKIIFWASSQHSKACDSHKLLWEKQTFTHCLKTGHCWMLIVTWFFNYRACHGEMFMRLPAFTDCQGNLVPSHHWRNWHSLNPSSGNKELNISGLPELWWQPSPPLFSLPQEQLRDAQEKAKEAFQQETKTNHFRINIIPQPWRAIKLTLLVKRRA